MMLFIFRNKENEILFGPHPKRSRDTNGREHGYTHIPYLYLAWPGLRQNYPRQFGHGLASLPIYTGSENYALLANYPIYI